MMPSHSIGSMSDLCIAMLGKHELFFFCFTHKSEVCIACAEVDSDSCDNSADRALTS